MACPCTPLSIAAICCAGSVSPSPTHCVATKHLTRSRAVSRRPGRFPRRFLSSLACACPSMCLYANRSGAAERIRGVCPPATYAVRWLPVRHASADSGWGGRVNASQRTPPGGSLCSRSAICPDTPAAASQNRRSALCPISHFGCTVHETNGGLSCAARSASPMRSSTESQPTIPVAAILLTQALPVSAQKSRVPTVAEHAADG